MNFSCILTALVFTLTVSANAADLESVLKKVDAIRNPASSFSMKVQVKSTEHKDAAYLYDVSCSGRDKTLIKTLAPPTSQGKKYLMLGEDMWAFTPELSRPVRISLNQKLNGQAANGDISRMRWSGDYSPVLEKETPAEWQLMLTAKKSGLTYEKIRAWVDKKTFRPSHAEFLSVSAKPLKTALYRKYRMIAGGERPTEILISDIANAADKSLITIQEMTVKSFPDSIFNQNAMR